MAKFRKTKDIQKDLQKAEKLIAGIVTEGRRDGVAAFHGVNAAQLAVSVDALEKCSKHLSAIHDGLNGLAATSTDANIRAMAAGPNKDDD